MTEESSKIRGSASVITPPTNGQRKTQAPFITPHHPAVSQDTSGLVAGFQRQPAASTDFVANNLQQILASLTSDDRLGSHASMMYRPPQAHLSPPQQAKPPLANRPVPYSSAKTPVGNWHQEPQVWSPKMSINSQLGPVMLPSTQASLRHETPGPMQQMNMNRQSGLVTPAVVQASLMNQINTNHQPSLFAPLSLKSSLSNGNPARVQQGSTVVSQRIPLRQNLAGRLPQFSVPLAPGKLAGQNQNQEPKVAQPFVFSDRVSSYEQIQNPIVWHIPLRGTNRGWFPRGFQKPFLSASPFRPSQLTWLGQNKFIQTIPVQNRTAAGVQRQQPPAQKQRINTVQPLTMQNNINSLLGRPLVQNAAFLAQQQQHRQNQQTSLASKMALLEESTQVQQTNRLTPSQSIEKMPPSSQLAANKPKYLPSAQTFRANYFPRPPYSLNAQQRVITPSARVRLKPVHPPLAQHLPQRIPQRQVSPFRPHYIYGQQSWPWGPWRNRVPPTALASSRSSNPLHSQANPANSQRYQPTSDFASKLAVSPYAATPQVLLYYFYPRTITKPLLKLTNVKEDQLKGSFLEKLRGQISSAALNRKPGVATLSRKTSVTGQTGVTPTATQFEQLKPNISPYGAFEQLVQIPNNTPYHRLFGSLSDAPLSKAVVTGQLVNKFTGKHQVQGPLSKTQLGLGMRQATYLPLLTPKSIWRSPILTQQLKAPTTVNAQSPVVDMKSQQTNGLLHRPVYIQTVPYQLYNLLQQFPSFNTQSGTQRYLSRVLSDILGLRYDKRKKKKKKRGAKEGKLSTV